MFLRCIGGIESRESRGHISECQMVESILGGNGAMEGHKPSCPHLHACLMHAGYYLKDIT